ncbi:hypothetical protein CJ030_MR0G027771 [Morella rubra]|uniref:Uncharacterized protein n=1 Tax=Morella rubra TaxID=262757 RepID=A0A6A1UFB6_9ROSI|nr:hypothetical protein CJ030_MR0G027771 [Morella rubra]
MWQGSSLGHFNLYFSLYRCSSTRPHLVITHLGWLLARPPFVLPVIAVGALKLCLRQFASHFPLGGDRPRQGGSEDIPHVFSPISRVHMEIPVPAVKEIREIQTSSFSISLAAPSVRGESLSSPGAYNPIATSTLDLPGTLTADGLETDEKDRPTASSGLQNLILLFDFASGGSDLPKIGGSLEVQSDMILSSGALSSISSSATVPYQEQPSVPGTSIVGGSSTSMLVLAGKPSTSAANVTSGPIVLPTPLVRGKE